MRRWKLIGLLGGLVVVAAWLVTALMPPPVVLDLPGLIGAQQVSGRSSVERYDGTVYWSRLARPGFSRLELGSLTPGGPVEVATGDFAEPIGSRSRAMRMLGTEDDIPVVERAPIAVLHRGGPFGELRLFRRGVSEYTGFWAATPGAVAAMDAAVLSP